MERRRKREKESRIEGGRGKDRLMRGEGRSEGERGKG